MMLDFAAQVARAVAVTPSDTDDISVTIGVYVGVSGDLTVDFVDGSTVTLTALAAGVFHPLQVRRIYATGTDATDIVAGYPPPA